MKALAPPGISDKMIEEAKRNLIMTSSHRSMIDYSHWKQHVRRACNPFYIGSEVAARLCMDMYLFYDLASAIGLASHGIRSSCLLEQYPRLRKIYIDVIEGKIRSSYRRFTSSRYNPKTMK